jgi:large repetitive protein
MGARMKTRFLLLALLAASSYAQTGTFAPTGNMTVPRAGHTATLLPDGRVLIVGGYAACVSGPPCLRADHAELYDPAIGTFTATGSMATASATGAVLLPNGKVLIGYDETTASVELYDPSTGEFHTVGKPAMLKGVGFSALLNDGRVLLGAELYDPVSGTFSPVANWPVLQDYWYPFVLAGGEVLFVPVDSLSGCDIYDPATGTFNRTRAIAYYEFPPATTSLLNGAVLFAGGSDGWLGWAQLYDPAAGIVAPLRMSYRDFPSATLLPDGTVLVAGGAGLYGVTLARTEIYDPATSEFSTTGSLASARVAHTATLLNNGQVLITGGGAFPGAGYQPSPMGTPINQPGMSSAELYTPAVLVPAPVLFSTSSDGKGQGAIRHAQTGKIASAENPAVGGEALSMYTTSLADGSVIAPQVIVGGRLAQVLYYGAAPGYPGYYQVNFVVPAGVPPGPAVSVRLTYIGRSSNAVTIGVR